MKKKLLNTADFQEKALFPIYRLKIMNITSEKCVETIKDVIRKIPGVKNISVNLKENNPQIIICSNARIDIIMEEMKRMGLLIELKASVCNLRVFYY